MDQRRVSQAEDEIMFVHNYHTLPRIPIRFFKCRHQHLWRRGRLCVV
jgi:hypothetical protein